MIRHVLRLTLPLVLLCALAACAQNSSEAQSETSAEEAPAGETAKPEVPPEPREERQLTVFILPAPSEILDILSSQEASAAVRNELQEPLPSFENLPSWRASLALGRTISELLLLVPDASTDEISRYLRHIRTGLQTLNIEEQRVSDLETLRTQIVKGSMEREELIHQLDRLRSQTLQEAGNELSEETVALIATGGWARATNAVSRVARESGELPEAASVLKLRLVVQTLINELDSTAEAEPIIESLETLLPITQGFRPSAPTPEELNLLIAETDKILSYTRER